MSEERQREHVRTVSPEWGQVVCFVEMDAGGIGWGHESTKVNDKCASFILNWAPFKSYWMIEFIGSLLILSTSAGSAYVDAFAYTQSYLIRRLLQLQAYI